MMRPDPDHNSNLIHFLKRYQPSPPPSSPQLEERVMALVRQSPRSPAPSSLRFWAIPAAIAASLALLWGSQPRPLSFVSQQPNEAVLASYLVNNWQMVTRNTENGELMDEEPTETNHWQWLISSETMNYETEP